MSVALYVDLGDRSRLAETLYQHLVEAIVRAQLREGDLLPPTRQLAATLRVSRSTVTAAYDRLAGDGYVTARVGSGTFVSARRTGTVEAIPPEPAPTAVWLKAQDWWTSRPEPYTFPTVEFDFTSGFPDAARFPYETGVDSSAASSVPRSWVGPCTPSRPATGGCEKPSPTCPGRPGHPRQPSRHRHRQRHSASPRHRYPRRRRPRPGRGHGGSRIRDGEADLRRPRDQGQLCPTRCPRPAVDQLPDDIRLVYVTPTHQFPMGMTMSLERRLELLQSAKAHGAAILEDDYDSDFHRDPGKALHTLDTEQSVVYVGTFSKSLLPVLRLGFILAPPALHAAIHAAKQLMDWHTNLPLQAALAEFIDTGGFARHVRKMGGIYQRRRAALVRALNDQMRQYVQVVPPAAGIHLCAHAKPSMGHLLETAAREALASGVSIEVLSDFSRHPNPRRGLILGYGLLDEDRIAQGVQRLATHLPATTANG